MEFWIFIVISIIGVLIISTIFFIVKCVGYKKVFKKIRARTMSSSQAEDPEAIPANVVLPAPPAYDVAFQHPVIARGPQISESSEGVSVIDAPDTPEPEVLTPCSGTAFPVESAIFVPPPYCLEPPAYSDVINDARPEDSVEAPRYSRY